MAVIGIDLGSVSGSAHVQLDGDQLNSFALDCEPVVALATTSGWLVGKEARRVASAGGGEAVWNLLELMGRKKSDLTVTQMANWPFQIIHGTTGKALVEFRARSILGETQFAPEELLAVVLARVRQQAEQRAGCVITEASVTIPVGFNYTQRQALRDACSTAGLNARRLVVSSTAAGVALTAAYGERAVGELLLAVDFGASSVNVSIIAAQSLNRVAVKAVAGDSSLGGAVLTERIVGHLLRTCNIQAAVTNLSTLHRLRRACQLAKKMLSTSDEASVYLQIESGAFSTTITRSEFVTICSDCWNRVAELVNIVLCEGHVTKEHINGVLLCGGSAAIPAVQQLMKNLFPSAAMFVNTTDNLQSKGAALLVTPVAETPPPVLLVDVLPLAVGVQRAGAKDITELVPSNARLPASGESLFFSGSQDTDVTYRMLEDRHLRQMAVSPHHLPPIPHCFGSLLGPSALHPSALTPTQLVAKVTIRCDMTEELQLSATIVDLATKQSSSVTFLGDESALVPRETISRAKTELDQLYGSHRPALTPEELEISNGDTSRVSRVNALREYGNALRKMVETKTLEVPISDDDGKLLSEKIDEVLEWLSSQSASTLEVETFEDTRSAADATDGDAVDEALEEVMQRRLVALRRLHWSVAATSAIGQLREETD